MSVVTRRVAGIELFAGLDPAMIDRIASSGATMTYRPGDLLVEQGKADRAMYVLLEGDAAVDVNGERIATVPAGAYFGETALIDAQPRSATVRAGEQGAKAWVISALAFEPLLREHEVARSLLVALTRRVRALEAERPGAIG